MSCQDENVYEAEVHYANESVNLGVPPRVPPRQNVTKKRTFKKLWRVIAAVLGLTTIILLGTTIALVVTQRQQGGNLEPISGSNKEECTATAKSCSELRKNGAKTNGVYRIQPAKNSPSIETYCDMETDGGGWTLVASIHESDIKRKCYTDDVWSSYVPGRQIGLTGENTNWENEMTFGNVYQCSKDDYKNAVYYSSNASNVMIWHVQAGFHIELMRSRATLRYRTTDDFLQSYGGNLKNLFRQHLPLTVKSDQNHSQILHALVKNSDMIKKQIPDWYEYTLGTSYLFYDSRMYNSYGNRVYFRSSRRGEYMYYGRSYRWSDSFTMMESTTTTPFTLVSVVRNDDGASSFFDIEVYGRRRYDTSDIVRTSENTTILGNFKLQYHALQLLYPSYHTPCRFVFVVSNIKDWNSKEPSKFYCDYCSYSYYDRLSRYRITGSPARLIFGYVLLTRKSGRNFTSEHLNNVANVILDTIAKFPNVFQTPSTVNTLVVPITFDKGSTGDVMSTIPPNFQSVVQPGYLQFRAYNYTGYPNAICPAVSVNSLTPEYVCIGGISGDITPHGTCGDFAGWGGKSTDSLLPSQPSGSAHSQIDVLSTILVFYR